MPRNGRPMIPVELFHQVPDLIAEGWTYEAIAAWIGCTASTMKVRCSQLKISLRMPPDMRKRKRELLAQQRRDAKILMKKPHYEKLEATLKSYQPKVVPLTANKRRAVFILGGRTVSLSRVASSLLLQKADDMGKSGAELITELLELIVKDDLYEAILGGRDEGARGHDEPGARASLQCAR